MSYKISVNGKEVRKISRHWDTQGYFSITAMNACTGSEIANSAFNALNKLAADGYSSHNKCHRAAIWPDGVKTLPNGTIEPLDTKERMAIFTVVLRRIMKMGLSNYHAVFTVTGEPITCTEIAK